MHEQNVLMHNKEPESYLPIFVYPNLKLREKVQPVTDFGPDLQQTIEKMKNTMYVYGGVGLAATQVGIPLDIFVLDVTEERNGFRVFINTTLYLEGDEIPGMEGCLSFPGVLTRVLRSETVKGTTQDQNGNVVLFDADGIEAVAIQHEMDHLKGILLVDKVGKLSKRDILKTLNKTMKKIPGSSPTYKVNKSKKGGPKRKHK